MVSEGRDVNGVRLTSGRPTLAESERGVDAGKILEEKMTVGRVKMQNRNLTHDRNRGCF